VAIEDTARFFLFFVFVDDSLAASVELLHILVEDWKIVEDDSGVLVLSVVDEGENEEDALSHAWNQFPCGFKALLCLCMRLFQLFDLFVIELVADD
jgi:hypothetical protein